MAYNPIVKGGGTEAEAQRVTIANDSSGLVSVDDNGGSLTVDGTVTANLSATDNAVLDTIASPVATVSATPLQRVAVFDASDTQITSFGGGTQYTEDAAAAANPVGNAMMLVREDARAGGLTTTDGDNVAARGNNKGELYVKTTDSDALLTTIDADTSSIAADASTIAGKDFSTETTLASLNSKVTAVNTGAVVVSSSALPSGASTAAKQPALGSAGVASSDVITVQGITSMTPLTVDLGVNNDVTVTSGSITATQGTATNLKAQAEVYQGGVAVGAAAPLQVSVANTGANATAIKVNVASGGIASGAIASGALAAGSIAVGAIAAGATSIAANEDDASANADRGVKILAVQKATPANTAGTDGDYEMLQMSAGRLWVDASGKTLTVNSTLQAGSASIGILGSNSGVDIGDVTINNSTGASAVNIQDGGNSITVDGTVAVSGTPQVIGSVAHDGVDADAPVKIGARAVNTSITAVANNDRTDLIATLTGKLITQPYACPESFVSGAITTAMTGTTSTSLISAPAAGLRNYITQITVSNSHATVGTDVIIQDGSGGTTLYTIPAAAAYGGATISFPTPLKQTTTATALYCANVTTGSSTKVSASGYVAP